VSENNKTDGVAGNIVFLSFDENDVVALVDPDFATTARELRTWAESIAGDFSFLSDEFEVCVADDGEGDLCVEFTVNQDSEGVYRSISYGATGPQQRQLIEAIKPRYTTSVTASATVERTDSRHHTGTDITLHVSQGRLTGSEVKAVRSVDGVDGARLDSNQLVFAMETPSYDEGVVAALVKAVCKAAGLYLSEAVVILDHDPSAQLRARFDYKAPADA
jgi:hypothetical protein